MTVLTPAQRATLQKVLAACNQALPRIELLEGMGAHSQGLADRARELRARREYLVNMANTALELDRQISERA